MGVANNTLGLYVVFDGIIGCGKSAQINVLKTSLPHDFPQLNFLFTYEPGGNKEADLLRAKLKTMQMDSVEEMELFAQSRKITLAQVVKPALLSKKVVISDRSFTTSLAYQAFGGRGLGIDLVWSANKDIVNGLYPDILVYINVGIDAALKRSQSENPDKFDSESRSFWEKNVDGYSKMINFVRKISPKTEIIEIVDPEGEKDIEEVSREIKEILYPKIDGVM